MGLRRSFPLQHLKALPLLMEWISKPQAHTRFALEGHSSFSELLTLYVYAFILWR